MKKILLLIPLLFLFGISFSQVNPVQITQPYNFLKWIKVKDSIRATIYFQNANDTLATKKYVRDLMVNPNLFVLKGDSGTLFLTSRQINLLLNQKVNLSDSITKWVTAHQFLQGLSVKADLITGKVPLNQIDTTILNKRDADINTRLKAADIIGKKDKADSVNGSGYFTQFDAKLKADLVDGKVPLSQINDVLLGSVSYQGSYSVITNTPSLPSATDHKGWYYIIADSGFVNLVYFHNRDWIVSNGSTWDKIDNYTKTYNNANATTTGLLTNTDWTTFNNKQNAITTGTTAQYFRGDFSLATFPTIPTVNDATLTLNTGTGLSGSTTFTANQSTPATFTVGIASGYYLPSTTDQSNWNGKQAAINGTGFVKASGTTITYDNSSYQPLATVLTNTTESYTTTIDTRLANTSGTNTGDNAVNSLYSGLVSNATHTGDATGSTVLTLATVNANVGTFNNVTVNGKGLVTAASNVSYLTSYTETDPIFSAWNKSTGISITKSQVSDFGSYQAPLSGTGLVRMSGTTLTYDNNSYYLASNPSSFISGITSTMVTTALGYTPYNATNPNSYISGNQTITLGNDLSGSGTTTLNATVTKIQGVSVDATSPTTGDYLNYNGTSWVHSALPTYPTLSSLGAVSTSTTVNGHALGSNVTVSASDVGLSNVTNNAQWYSGNHPTTVSGYGITDIPTYSGSNFILNQNASAQSANMWISGSITVTGGNIINVGNGGNTNGAALRLLGTSQDFKNWQIGNYQHSPYELEFTPSTTNGGTTFTTPVFTLTSSGAATFSSTVSASQFNASNLTNGKIPKQATGGLIDSKISEDGSGVYVNHTGNPSLTLTSTGGAYSSLLTLNAAGGGASNIYAVGGQNSFYFYTNGTQALSIDNTQVATFTANTKAPTFQSTVETGTAPLTVASTTMVGNLNADMLDGQHGSYYQSSINGITFSSDRWIPTDNTYYLGDNVHRWKNIYTTYGSADQWQAAYNAIYTNTLTTNYLTKWSGSGLVDSKVSDDNSGIITINSSLCISTGTDHYNWSINPPADNGWGYAVEHSGSSYFTTTKFSGNGTTDRGFRVWNATTNDYPLIVYGTGQVSIPSTAPSTSSTTGALTVVGGIGVGGAAWINGHLQALGQDPTFRNDVSLNMYLDGIGVVQPSISFSKYSTGANDRGAKIQYVYYAANISEAGGLAFYTNPDGNASNGLTERGRFTNDGKFFLGYTADPTSGNKLAVNGNGYFGGSVSNPYISITSNQINSTSGDELAINYAGGTKNTSIYYNSGNLAFKINGSTGNATFSGSVTATGATFTTGSHTGWFWADQGSGVGGWSPVPSYSGVNFIVNGTTQQTSANFNIDGNGVLGGSITAANVVSSGTVTGTDFIQSSDSTLKKNITKLAYTPLPKSVYRFNFKADATNEPHFGVIAQEIQKYQPDLVTKNPETGKLQVKYIGLMMLMLNNAQIERDQLKAELKKQNERIKKLEMSQNPMPLQGTTPKNNRYDQLFQKADSAFNATIKHTSN